MRVLVIEDDEDVTLLYRLALESAGHVVDTVTSGEAGLRHASAAPPDVVVLDGMLPDIDGLEVLDQLVAMPSTAHVPVVMASARVGSTDLRAATDRGAAAYLVKPFDLLQLTDVVHEVGRDRSSGDAELRWAGVPLPAADDQRAPSSILGAGPEHVARAEASPSQALNPAFAAIVSSAVERESHEERLRSFLDAVPDATIVVDADGRIVSANAQAESLFGYSRDELLRMGVDALVPEGSRVRHAAHRDAYGDERRQRSMGEGLVLSARRRDGSTVPVDIMLRPLDTDEGPLVVAAVRDVTERRRNEAIREAFLHAVSHELRTPLTSVIGFSSLLTDHMADQLSEDALDLVHRIRGSAAKLERLLGDLLDLDRLGRGVLEAQRHSVDIASLVHHTVETLSTDGRTLRVAVEPADLVADVDPAQVERIIENLVVNAVRHTPGTAHIDVRVARSTNGILIVVEDDGPGVPASQQESIFEPFQRDPASATTPGTGIGLSLVARFAELHGGRAWVEDRPGGGASFRVVLAT